MSIQYFNRWLQKTLRERELRILPDSVHALELFETVRRVKRTSVHYDESGRPLGSAEVESKNHADAVNARKRYNNVPLDGEFQNIIYVRIGDSNLRRINGVLYRWQLEGFCGCKDHHIQDFVESFIERSEAPLRNANLFVEINDGCFQGGRTDIHYKNQATGGCEGDAGDPTSRRESVHTYLW